MNPYIRTENISFAYLSPSGEKLNSTGGEDVLPVLSDLNIVIEKGTFVAIIGHNGSGKTTLAKHFNAILLPCGGKVYVSEMDTSDEQLLLEIRRRTGMVFQNPDNQIVATVVEEDVAFAPENLGIPSDEIRQRVDEALRIVDMYHLRTHAPHLLSGGQKQRIAIAGVLAMKPECIIFDEPTAMLDPKGRQKVLEIMKDLRDNHGITVILITHSMGEAASADRVIVMSDGKIIKDGPPHEVFLDIETLNETGLGVPETVLLLNRLKEDGFNVPLNALSVDECAKAICSALAPSP